MQNRVRDGVDYIKIMHESGDFIGQALPKPSLDVQSTIVREAHHAGLLAVAHSTSLQDTLQILDCGVDGLTHTFIDSGPTKELVDAYKRNGSYCNPTLAVLASATAEGTMLQTEIAHDPRVSTLLGQEERDRMCRCLSIATRPGMTCENAFETVKRLKHAGIDILA